MGTHCLVPTGQLYVMLLQSLGLLGHDGFLVFITASSPGLSKRDLPHVFLQLFLYLQLQGVGGQSARPSSHRSTLLRATLKSPFLLKKTCHRLISLEEDLPYGKRIVRGELTFPTSLSSKVSCMWIKAHWEDARRHISTCCSSCQHNINHPCPTLSLFFSKTFVPALSTCP